MREQRKYILLPLYRCDLYSFPMQQCGTIATTFLTKLDIWKEIKLSVTNLCSVVIQVFYILHIGKDRSITQVVKIPDSNLTFSQTIKVILTIFFINFRWRCHSKFYMQFLDFSLFILANVDILYIWFIWTGKCIAFLIKSLGLHFFKTVACYSAYEANLKF